ncbi:MAG: sulfite exporter TauE/SafE family protein [Vulcanimicrobiaceae bacterium]
MNAELVLVGFVVGMLVSLTGIAGGSIVTPLLIALNVAPLTAVSTDLLYSAPTSLFASYLQHRQRNVDWVMVGTLVLGAVPAALAGTVALIWLRSHVGIAVLQSATRHAVGAAVMLAALIIVLRPWLVKTYHRVSDSFVYSIAVRLRLAAVGAIVGIIFALTSVGSGSLMLPMLAIILPTRGMRSIVGSSIASAAVLILSTLLVRSALWSANIPFAISLIAGSLPGVFVGGKISNVLQQQYLRPVIAVILVIAGARMALR